MRKPLRHLQGVSAILFRNAGSLLDQLQKRLAGLIELIRIFGRGAFGSPRKWNHIDSRL